MNAWLTFSLILFGVWLIIFIIKPALRREMLWAGLFTMPFGLTEPLFVPEYWSPPSLFNLAAKTGFDIESFIFTFAVGGIGAVLYETLVKVKHERIRHKFHLSALAIPFVFFLPLYFLTKLNPIYSASIAMLAGSIAAIVCRPDLTKKICAGGLMFLVLYFIFFSLFNLMYPGIVQQVWNLQALSDILVLGVPLEELMFALTFGMLWSSLYEHFLWYKLKRLK